MSAPVEPAGASRCGLMLTGLLAAVYFGFVGLVAFAPRLVATPIVGVISFGLVAAVVVIALALVLTAFYVWRGNRAERS